MTEILDRPWGGDKVGFDFPDLGGDSPGAGAQAELRRLIGEHREAKRDTRKGIESTKDRQIRMINKLAALDEIKALREERKKERPGLDEEQAASSLRLTGPVSDAKGPIELDGDRVTLLLAKVLKAAAAGTGVIAARKDVLHEYHDSVGSTAGWDWSKVKAKLEERGFTVAPGADVFSDAEMISKDGITLGCARFGANRVRPKRDEWGVLVQHGFANEPEDVSRRKEYVTDFNDVLTRRFVTRPISHFQIAEMIGLAFDGATFGDPKEYSDRRPGHYPRGDPEHFGGHVTTLNPGKAAVLNPDRWTQSRAGQDHRYWQTNESDAGEELEHTGLRAFDLESDATRNSTMTAEEAANLQLRNGSGPQQNMLSTTSIQQPVDERERKLVHGNKGEPFSGSPETVAEIEIDLSRAALMGINFLNRHSTDSDDFKIAYDRWVEVKGTDGSVSMELKRRAKDELDEYIYSGRKNREVTIDKVPNGMISRINFDPGIERFEGWDPEFPFKPGWQEWKGSIVDDLRSFFDPAKLDRARVTADKAKKAMGSDGFD